MKVTVKWGIMGCGGIANKFAEGAVEAEGVEVIAAASRTPGKAEAFAEKHGIKSHYSDYEQLLKNKEIDIVYIATTHNFHYENALQVLESGKAILCEKPFTVNSREMAALIQKATDTNLFMMEAMWTRFLPAMVQIRSWLNEGMIGEVRQIRASLGFNFDLEPSHRMLNPALAGGVLLDMGIYPLSFANMIMKTKPIEMKALGEIGPTGVDVSSSYLLKYQSGCLAMLNTTIKAPIYSRAEIIGSLGKIVIPSLFIAASKVIIHMEDQEPQEMDFPFDDSSGFKFEIEAASDSFRKGLIENEVMPLSDTLQLMETIDELKSQLGLVYENDRL